MPEPDARFSTVTRTIAGRTRTTTVYLVIDHRHPVQPGAAIAVTFDPDTAAEVVRLLTRAANQEEEKPHAA